MLVYLRCPLSTVITAPLSSVIDSRSGMALYVNWHETRFVFTRCSRRDEGRNARMIEARTYDGASLGR